MVGQMERLSKRRKMFFWSCAMNANTAMAALRDGITLGDFDDDTRNQRPSEVSHVRATITTFLEQLDQALYSWMR
jgi:hypothetical protein